MGTNRSDTSSDTIESHKDTVREYLRANGEVASKATLRAETDPPSWYIEQIASTDTFYTSLNHNGAYVASKHVIGRRAPHDGFWRPEVDDGQAVFHCKETTKATLKHLAFNRPSGLRAAAAKDLLGRRCYRALSTLAEQQEIHAANFQDTTVGAVDRSCAEDPQETTDTSRDAGYCYATEMCVLAKDECRCPTLDAATHGRFVSVNSSMWNTPADTSGSC